MSVKPTVVLMHGAFAESASWNGVIADLHSRGYKAIAVANPLRGLQEDAAYLQRPGRPVRPGGGGRPLLRRLGHERGRDRRRRRQGARLRRQLPTGGRREHGGTGRQVPGASSARLDSVAFPAPDGDTGTDLYIQQDRFQEVFAADVARDVAALMAATQRPIAASALEDVATEAAWKTIPSWSLVTTQDLAIPAESMRFMSARAGSTTVEIDASHAVTVSKPGAVAELIDAAARAVEADLSDVAVPARVG